MPTYETMNRDGTDLVVWRVEHSKFRSDETSSPEISRYAICERSLEIAHDAKMAFYNMLAIL